jgi:hypothetical protein
MPLSFTCPCCRAHLKVRDQSSVGQTLDCPECHTPLLVATTTAGEIIGQQIVPEKSSAGPVAEKKKTPQPDVAKKPNPKAAPKVEVAEPEVSFQPFPGAASGSRTPQIVACSVAAVCVLCLIPLVLPSSKSNSETSDSPDVSLTQTGPADASQTGIPATETPSSPDGPKPDANLIPRPEDKPAPIPDTPEGKLSELGKILLEQAAKEGHFPAGTVKAGGLPVSHRWSWQAKIAATAENPLAFPIDWGQRWNDPAADRFVRRPISRFQNSLVELQVSEDKYPASHFVGVAGVGTDAPTLPIDHPRAGIFGQDRQTKLEDIHDGASNTMLLAGVEQHAGSWAEGATSYRPFTREPYIHGPDGFGTGQQKSMFVLMADGSVKEIRSDVDPAVVRGLATMNDGIPIDPRFPRKSPTGPLKSPKPVEKAMKPETAPPEPVAANPQPGKAALPPIKPAPEVIIDIPAALSRKILSFDQSKPVPAYQLLLQIEELAAVRIDYDREKLGAAAERLDQPITLKMQNATLEDLLNDILRQIDLKRLDEKSRIRIVEPK